MCDQEEKNYCCECKMKDKKCCIDIIIFIISILLALTIGLIIGSLPIIGIILLIALPALIVLAVILLLLIFIRIIELKCDCNNKK